MPRTFNRKPRYEKELFGDPLSDKSTRPVRAKSAYDTSAKALQKIGAIDTQAPGVTTSKKLGASKVEVAEDGSVKLISGQEVGG